MLWGVPFQTEPPASAEAKARGKEARGQQHRKDGNNSQCGEQDLTKMVSVLSTKRPCLEQAQGAMTQKDIVQPLQHSQDHVVNSACLSEG